MTSEKLLGVTGEGAGVAAGADVASVEGAEAGVSLFSQALKNGRARTMAKAAHFRREGNVTIMGMVTEARLETSLIRKEIFRQDEQDLQDEE